MGSRVEGGTVLVVGDESEAVSRTAAVLDRSLEAVETRAETSIEDARDRLLASDASSIDGVVCRDDASAVAAVDLAATVCECAPGVPVVLVVAGASDEAVRRALDLGVDVVHDVDAPGGTELLAHRVARAVESAHSETDPIRTYERFGHFLEHATDYIFVIDESGTVQYVTPSVERVLGFDPADVVGSSGFGYVHPDDKETVAEELSVVLEEPNAEARIEIRGRHADGSWRRLELFGRNFLDDPAVGGIVVNVRDVTARESYAETLATLHEASRELVRAPTRAALCEEVAAIARSVIDLPHATLFLYDETTGRLEPEAVSQEARESFGQPPRFEPGEGLVGGVYETGEPIFLSNVREDERALDREEASDWIRGYMVLDLGDHGVVTFASPEVGAFDRTDFEIANIVAANATVALDQLASQAELARQRDLFGRAQTIANVGAWEYEVSSDRLSWSEEASQIFDLPEEASGSPEAVLERVHAEDRPTVREAFRRAVSHGEPFDLELRLGQDSHHQRWARLRGDPAIDGDANTVRGTLNAITERKENERHLNLLDRLLRHNVRNEMTVIRGLAETIEEDADATVSAWADQIVEGCDTLLDSMEKEREIVKTLTGSSTRRPIDVAAATREAVLSARASHPTAEIDLSTPEAARAIVTENLATAIAELVENAVRHAEVDRPTVSVDVRVAESAVIVEVVDDGPGIPDHDQAVVAGDHEIQDLYHGSGVGLWLVDWIVRRSNGSLRFDDRQPRGTVVTIELPRE